MQRSPFVPAVVAALLAASGCTPSVTPPSPSSGVSSPSSASPAPTLTLTLSPSPSPSPSPTQTLDDHQVAAIRAVDTYEAVTAEIGGNPSGFTKAEMTSMFETAVGENMVKGNVDFFLAMAERGYREVGTRQAISTVSSDAQDNGRGTEVHVTRCWDQRDIEVVDADGESVKDEEFQYPPYNLRQYTVLQLAGEKQFRVYGAQTINGACP